MKKYYSIIFLLFTVISFAQIPSNYYDSANGLSGYALKTELRNITANGHSDQGYDAIYTAYESTHTDNYYENDGSVLDFYSEKPLGPDSYFYTHGNNQCGSYNSENDCYNREHLVPQSSYNEAYPMRSDVHHVIPSDGYVNNRRGSFPFGIVASATWTSTNGSKVGSSDVSGYSGTVFEPIDEFKGDIARALLYFATRYENTVDGYTSFDMFNGTEDQVFHTWAIDMLLDWHYNVDPVDQSEIDRNNAAYNFQGNANPFVNHPEYADIIWNPTPDTQAPTVPTNLMTSNPSSSTIDLNWTASTDNTGVTGYDVYVDGSFYIATNSASTTFTVTGLASETTNSFTVLAKDAANNMSAQSSPTNGTTTAGSSGGTDCAAEDFENIPANSGSYDTRTWTGIDGISNGWTATDARTDQTLNGRAICIRNGILTSPSIAGGIGDLTVTAQATFGADSSGTLDVLVNGISVGSAPYNDNSGTTLTTTISNINVTGNITIVLDDQSSSNRVRIDDLSWTCYDDLGIEENSISNIKFYPNPLNGDKLYIETNQELNIEIFNILGKRIISDEVNSNKKHLNLSNLNSGIYLIKISNNSQTITKKLIKQ